MISPIIDYCASCNAPICEGTKAYCDDYEEQHFCSGGCFRDWCADNHEKIVQFYRKMNVSKEFL